MCLVSNNDSIVLICCFRNELCLFRECERVLVHAHSCSSHSPTESIYKLQVHFVVGHSVPFSQQQTQNGNFIFICSKTNYNKTYYFISSVFSILMVFWVCVAHTPAMWHWQQIYVRFFNANFCCCFFFHCFCVFRVPYSLTTINTPQIKYTLWLRAYAMHIGNTKLEKKLDEKYLILWKFAHLFWLHFLMVSKINMNS